MEAYGRILLFAMPAFLALVLLENWVGWLAKKERVSQMDTISSLSSGITNVTKDVLGLSLVVISYEWLVRSIAIVHLRSSWELYIIAFLALDFAGYWVHRIAHRYNLFWNNHIIHHSSEEFNLACALRQSISGFIKIFALFLVPAALLGVPGSIIAVVAPIQLFAQFWYHTRHIGKMGWLEKVIVTPSHHRVHHAINPEYMDRNFSQIFIVWDKLFGTFQPELHSVLPVYGITRPARTWNPVKINFMHLWLLIRDAWHTGSWRDKCRIWFMPTGWRPADVAHLYPVVSIADVYGYEKYAPPYTRSLLIWCWIQLTVLLLFTSYLFGNISAIGSPLIFLYGLFIFLSVFALAELMDGRPAAPAWELLKNLLGASIILRTGTWFALPASWAWVNYMVEGWLLVATLVTAAFTRYSYAGGSHSLP